VSLLTDLIAYWQLDEASGNRSDSHGSATLTDNNTVASAAGKISSAADFEANNLEYLSVADNAALSTGDIDFTFSCWVNVESFGSGAAGTGRVIVAKDASAANREYRLWFSGSSAAPMFLVLNNGGTNATATWGANLSLATWYHIVAWHDSVNNQVGIAVNAGTPVTTSYSGGAADSTAPFVLGRLDGDGVNFRYFDGLIDEVGFWKRVLTSGERTQLYNGGAGLAYSSFGGGSGVADVGGGFDDF
jgi:concanavalin A-like lectin/glucanase superfamily protein